MHARRRRNADKLEPGLRRAAFCMHRQTTLFGQLYANAHASLCLGTILLICCRAIVGKWDQNHIQKRPSRPEHCIWARIRSQMLRYVCFENIPAMRIRGYICCSLMCRCFVCILATTANRETADAMRNKRMVPIRQIYVFRVCEKWKLHPLAGG